MSCIDRNVPRSRHVGDLPYTAVPTFRCAAVHLAVADFSVAQAWLSVVNDVRTAYANYDLNIKQATLFSAIRKLVFEQRDLVQAEYDAGQAEIVRLNEAQRNVVSAEGTLVQALANVQKARAQLEAAANINNLGRGFESVSGAAVTLEVLAKQGMKDNVSGTADKDEVDYYIALAKAEAAEEAAAEEAQDIKEDADRKAVSEAELQKQSEFVGPQPKK